MRRYTIFNQQVNGFLTITVKDIGFTLLFTYFLIYLIFVLLGLKTINIITIKKYEGNIKKVYKSEFF